MKKFLLFFILMSAVTLNAQKITEGSLSQLENAKQLNVVLDFSKATIDKYSEEDFLVKKSMEEDEGDAWKDYWNVKCKKLFLSKFCFNANERTGFIDLKLGVYPEAKYTAIFFIIKADDDGEIDGIIVIKETNSDNIVATISNVHGEGGSWGSIENLIGDGMEDAGKRFGKFLSKQIN